MRNIFLYIMLLFDTVVYGQHALLPLHNASMYQYESTLYANPSFHTSIKPYSRKEVMALYPQDSSKTPYLAKDDAFYLNNALPLHPVVNVIGMQVRSDSASTFLFQHTLGFDTYYEWKKVAVGASFFSDHSAYPFYYDSIIRQSEVVPGLGYAHPTSLGYEASYFSGYISYNPGKVFNLELGKGKHFIGDGYRSMLLSDAAYNYPYFKTSLNVWRAKYYMMLAQLTDIRLSNGNPEWFTNKSAVMHYLNLNVAKWFSFGFFETVIWQSQDNNFYRGFDVHYLNPIVFYRPIEYSLGSADNVLMGANMKFTIDKKNILYAQVMIDEFLLREVRANRGWWANKYAMQCGAKFFDLFGAKRLFLQGEVNWARPFTYAHDTKVPSGLGVQNYGHYNQPLAHPLGANFLETVGIIRYSLKRVHAEASFSTSIFGNDVNGKNMGGNIYNLYTTRAKNFDNKLLQGDKYLQVNTGLTFSYLINYASNMHCFAGVFHRNYGGKSMPHSETMISFGIRTNLVNRYLDF